MANASASVPTLLFGNDNIGAAAGAVILHPGYSSVTANASIFSFPSPRSGTLESLFVRHNLANGNGNLVVYTVLVNGVLTTITVTLATGAIGQISDLIHIAPILRGDLITIQASKALALGSGNIACVVGLDLTA